MGRPPRKNDQDASALALNLAAEYKRLATNRNAVATASGVNVDVLRSAEAKGTIPSADRLDAIARVLGRTPGQLLGTEPMTEPGTPPSPLTRLPPKTVKDQTQLKLLQWWGELSVRERRVILKVVEGLALDEE